MFSNTNNVNITVGGETVSVTSRKLTDLVQASIVYPKFKSVCNKEIKEATIHFSYQCKDASCQFSPVVQQILVSTLAESKGVREISATIVKELENVPTAPTTAGFIIQSGGSSVIYLENKMMKPTGEDNVGVIDITEVRRRLIHEHLSQQENKNHLGTALIGGTVGASFTAFVLLGALKLARKL
jgi:hypothetical protein